MAEKFNLLPKERKSTQDTKLSKALKYITISAFTLSLLILGGGFGYLYYLRTNLADTEAEVKKNKANISALEVAERGLVIAKDRAQNIQKLLDQRRVEKIYDRYTAMENELPVTMQISRVEANTREAEVEFLATRSKDFSDFLGNLIINRNKYSNLYLNSINIGENIGYTVSMEVE